MPVVVTPIPHATQEQAQLISTLREVLDDACNEIPADGELAKLFPLLVPLIKIIDQSRLYNTDKYYRSLYEILNIIFLAIYEKYGQTEFERCLPGMPAPLKKYLTRLLEDHQRTQKKIDEAHVLLDAEDYDGVFELFRHWIWESSHVSLRFECNLIKQLNPFLGFIVTLEESNPERFIEALPEKFFNIRLTHYGYLTVHRLLRADDASANSAYEKFCACLTPLPPHSKRFQEAVVIVKKFIANIKEYMRLREMLDFYISLLPMPIKTALTLKKPLVHLEEKEKPVLKKILHQFVIEDKATAAFDEAKHFLSKSDKPRVEKIEDAFRFIVSICPILQIKEQPRANLHLILDLLAAVIQPSPIELLPEHTVLVPARSTETKDESKIQPAQEIEVIISVPLDPSSSLRELQNELIKRLDIIKRLRKGNRQEDPLRQQLFNTYQNRCFEILQQRSRTQKEITYVLDCLQHFLKEYQTLSNFEVLIFLLEVSFYAKIYNAIYESFFLVGATLNLIEITIFQNLLGMKIAGCSEKDLLKLNDDLLNRIQAETMPAPVVPSIILSTTAEIKESYLPKFGLSVHALPDGPSTPETIIDSTIIASEPPTLMEFTPKI